MQRLVSVMLIAVALAGCADDDGSQANEAPDPSPADAVMLPENITASKDVLVGQDLGNLGGAAFPCANPTSSCDVYEFTIPDTGNASVKADAKLTWDLITNDFDLYLTQAGQVLASSGEATTTSEAFAMPLQGGDYEMWVVSWLVVGDTYNLDVTFEMVEEPDWDDEAA